jgi:hypothetical protein
MLTACPECGTQVVAGDDCPLCGTPTPAPPDAVSAAPPPGPQTPREPPPEVAQPVRGAAPPPDVGASKPMDTGARYANQWEVIYEKLRAAVAPKYGVTGILGWGGMAGVYLADEAKLGRKVAIKVMSPGLMVDPQLVERFSQEARTIAQFNHPNIVTIYEVDERDGLHYFTMTYVPGRTLGQVMAGTEGALPIPVVRAWIYQMTSASNRQTSPRYTAWSSVSVAAPISLTRVLMLTTSSMRAGFRYSRCMRRTTKAAGSRASAPRSRSRWLLPSRRRKSDRPRSHQRT